MRHSTCPWNRPRAASSTRAGVSCGRGELPPPGRRRILARREGDGIDEAGDGDRAARRVALRARPETRSGRVQVPYRADRRPDFRCATGTLSPPRDPFDITRPAPSEFPDGHLGVPAWKLPLIARHMRSLSARDIDELQLFNGIDTVLRSLSKAGLVLAVVSSNSEENVRRLLGPGLAELIGHFACGASLFGKAAKLRKVLKASGVSPAEVIC